MIAEGGGSGEGVGWRGSLRLVDANCYIESRLTLRSYCTAQGTLSSLLGQTMMEDNMGKRMCVYIYIPIYIYLSLYVCVCVCLCVCG